MEIGLLIVWQNFMDRLSDMTAYERDMAIADLAEPLGFDVLSSAEHHFFNISMAPDNIGFLNYMAGRTSRIKLMPGAIILPWHDPLKVVERMLVLDHLSKGRAVLAFGRGLAKREYKGFGVNMDESRDRFDEAAEIVLRGVETGIVDGGGKYYKYERTRVRPGPYASFEGRFNCVAMLSDSMPVCVRLGGKLMIFAHKPWESISAHLQAYRDLFPEYQGGREAPNPVCIDSAYCDESPERAEAIAREHITNYYVAMMDHYEIGGDPLRNGRSTYANNAEFLRTSGLQADADAYCETNIWGTPTQMLEKLNKRRQSIGNFDLMLSLSFGGMSREDVMKSMKLISEKVLPELRSWN